MVEIVEAEGAGEGVDELDVVCGGGDDVREVEGVEVGVADDGLVVDVADDGLRIALVRLGRFKVILCRFEAYQN